MTSHVMAYATLCSSFNYLNCEKQCVKFGLNEVVFFSGRHAEGLASQVEWHMPTGWYQIEVKCTCELGECTQLW